MRLTTKSLVLGAIAVSILVSCGRMPIYRIPSFADIAINWDGDPGESAAKTIRGLTEYDYGGKTPPFKSYYDGLGSLIGSYTPTRFELGIREIDLRNTSGLSVMKVDPISEWLFGGAEVTRDLCMADFVQESNFTPYYPPNSAFYNQMKVRFENEIYSTDGVYAGGEIEAWDTAYLSAIQVELPGYSDSDFPNVLGGFSMSGGTPQPYFDREYLGDNTFRFTWNAISPVYGFFEMYFTEDPEFRANVPGDPNWDVGALEIGHGVTHSFVMVFPFDPFFLAPSNEPVQIVVSWDVRNIVEVYDNSTPADRSDDIVTLRRGFWESLDIYLRE